jgi:hypothetical protein
MFLALSVLAVSLLVAGLVTLAVRGGSEDTQRADGKDVVQARA